MTDFEKRLSVELPAYLQEQLLNEVLPSAVVAEKERAKSDIIRNRRMEMEGVMLPQASTFKDRLWEWLRSVGKESSPYKIMKGARQRDLYRKSTIIKIFNALCLSGLNFLAMSSKILQVDLQAINSDQYILLGIAGITAITLTYSAKEAVSRWVKARGMIQERGSVYLALLKGDALAWCILIVVVGEAALIQQGLLSTLSPKEARELVYQVSFFAIGALSAFINVILAYATSLEEVKFTVQLLTASEKDANWVTAESLELHPWVMRAIYRRFDKEVREQDRIAKKAAANADRLRKRWQKRVDAYLKEQKRNSKKQKSYRVRIKNRASSRVKPSGAARGSQQIDDPWGS